MTAVNIKAWGLLQGATAGFAKYEVAAPEFADNGLTASENFTIGSPADPVNGIFATLEDGVDYYYATKAADLVALVNIVMNPIVYTLGNRVTVYDSIANNIAAAAGAATERTTSALSLTPVAPGTTTGGDTGTQIHATKKSSVQLTFSTQLTFSLSGSPESKVTLKKCATNDADEANWTVVGSTKISQPTGLELTVGQVVAAEGQITADLDAGWYVKAVKTGAGTHTEGFVSGEKTIYG